MAHLKISSTNRTDEHNNSLNHNKLKKLTEKLLPSVKLLLMDEKIPPDPSLSNALAVIYIPLALSLLNKQTHSPLIVGINGSQGSGKSTLAKIIKKILEQGFNKKVISFSIDDLYKTRDQRKQLAKTLHPLLSTRGVPGTHDTELGISIFNQLLNKKQTECWIPVFDKAIDDRLPESQWTHVNGNCDIILFDGWCVGSIAQTSEQLKTPINTLEKQQDYDGRWRSFVNQQLNGPYAELFSFIDFLIMLEIPSFNKVYEWRKLQEKKLSAHTANKQGSKTAIMSDPEIEHFIMHFERITKHTLEEMPERCDILLPIEDNHQIKKISTRRASNQKN
ncbi:D-glycerate 3-kinase, plant type [hydrothermal vent metagenome]|uniref:D-glycerate 3-kinase, plant type n=1 Tax=hydrothermal vent metagenome TaxID=652676 RepID=A0A3B0XB98_9ZZZZ